MAGEVALEDEHFVVVDGHNLLVRSWYAAAARGTVLSDADGVDTAPLTFFIGALAKQVAALEPTRLVVVFDEGASTRHAAIDPTYKAERPKGDGSAPEVFLVREFLALSGITVESRPGVEADDLIGAYWRQLSRWRMTIVSDDKDFFQLLCPSCQQVRPGQKESLWTEARLRVEHGCEPREWGMVLALAGDKADGVVGVPGIGYVKAVRLLHSLEGLSGLGALHWLVEHGPDRVVACGPRILANFEMVNLRNILGMNLIEPPPFEPVMPGQEGWEALAGFLDHHGLVTIKEKIVGGTLWSREPLTTP